MQDPYDLPTREELKAMSPKKPIKIGIGFSVLNNFKGFAESVHSIKTSHEWNLYMFDQWRLNRPLSQTWNQMALQAFKDGCDYALLCNDDILFSPGCIDAMVRVHQELMRARML